jgi:hypothetical protein
MKTDSLQENERSSHREPAPPSALCRVNGKWSRNSLFPVWFQFLSLSKVVNSVALFSTYLLRTQKQVVSR